MNRKTQKNKLRRKSSRNSVEPNSLYLLKLILYLIMGCLWLRITTGNGNQIPIPVGFMIGLLFASHEHFQIDKKIEYGVLLMAMFVGFWLPIGITILV